MKYFKLLRIEQYVKNIFVFAPVFFSLNFYSPHYLLHSVAAFVFFCLTASSIYIINDLVDVNEDKFHPTKKFRPIAAGKVNKNAALLIAICLGIVSIGASIIFYFELAKILLLYWVLNLLYSFKLKEYPIVDIFIISVGFVLRIFAGAAVTGIPITMWIVLVTFLLSLFLAVAKRRDDILLSSDSVEVRKSIKGYNLEFVNSAMTLMAGVVIVAYIFYTISPEVEEKYHTKNLYYTVAFVILGILRYMQVTFVENNSGNPTRILLKDGVLQVAILLWLACFLFIVS